MNIIDTPGFGDRKRDQTIIDQISQFLLSNGDKGILFIDAICLIVPAPEAHFTVSQKFIFNSIMSLFGKDIESNICTLITFADGGNPPVLSCLSEANLPTGSFFHFNNSALFAENKNILPTSMSPMFWEMGYQSFRKFFEELNMLMTRSLSQTKSLLETREIFKKAIADFDSQVKVGVLKLSELQKELDIFKKHKDDIENNEDFEYEVEETKLVKVEVKPGQHVTTCLNCNFTCHENCSQADDMNKHLCSAMTNGYCTVCTNKCIWSDHKNTRYTIKYTVEKVKKTYKEMKQKQAQENKMIHKTFIDTLTHDTDVIFESVNLRIIEIRQCKSRLQKIALRPDPLSAIGHIELMIQTEKMEGQSGYEQRIRVLNQFKQMAQIDENFANFEHVMSAKEKKAFLGLTDASEIDGKTLLRDVSFIKQFFFTPTSPTSPLTKRQNKKEK